MKQWFSAAIEGFREITGPTWIALLCFLILGVLVLILMRSKFTPRMMAAGALCIAVSFLLSCLTIFKLPQGGSITPASMLPILIFSWSFGPTAGILSGMAFGFLQMLQGMTVIHPLQVLLDYVFPFAVLGIAGYFRKNIFAGIFAAGAARFLCHFLSGFLFFAEYAPEGMNPMIYSLVYNGSYMAVEILVCMAVAAISQVRTMIRKIVGQTGT